MIYVEQVEFMTRAELDAADAQAAQYHAARRTRLARTEVTLRANSPMRPCAGRTEPVDGLALFDVARSPCML